VLEERGWGKRRWAGARDAVGDANWILEGKLVYNGGDGWIEKDGVMDVLMG